MWKKKEKKKKLLGLVSKRFFHAYTQLGVGCLWWFNYPGPLLHVELEFTCLSGLVINISLCIGYTICLYIAYIRPQPLDHWAASVAQWLEHLSRKQCRGFESHPSGSFFILCEKKKLLGLVSKRFFHVLKRASEDTTLSR